jgi:hypothetical protein
MADRSRSRSSRGVPRKAYWWTALLASLALTAVLIPARAQSPANGGNQSEAPHVFKPDAKKAKAAYQQGLQAEKKRDWAAAYSAYSDAVNWAPNEHEYALHREIARSQLVQAKADAAERDAISGRLDDARRELLSAANLDPSNRVVRERLTELLALEPDRATKVASPDIGGEIHLDYRPGTQNFDYRGDTQGAYDELAHRFGVEAAFDSDLRSRPVRFQIDNVDFPTAARLLGDMTHTFWRPLTRRLFFVTDDTPQKRKDYDVSVVRTVLLPASETSDQMTETLRTVREIAGITRSDLDISSHTLTLRASPRAIAVAMDLIDGLEQPRGEMILEMEVLEVDRNYARQLGIMPPQTSQIVTLTPTELQDIQQNGLQGILDVLTQIYGSAAIPPIVAFGGGKTTFFATMPGAAANFADMLSLVRHGRRILLRVQDGEPATFFVGDRIPVSLSAFAPSFTASGATPTGTIATPIANYAVGNDPVSIVKGSFHNTLFTSSLDLAVANKADDTISILQGNGDGTFQAQTVISLPTGFTPTALATTNFTNSGHQDLVVAGNVSGSSTGAVLVLLGNGDGTFTETTQSPIAVGNNPVFVVTSDFNNDGFQDLAVANQGSNSISIFLGKGDGTFSTPPPAPILLPAGSEPTGLAAADVNGDGKVDLVSANQGTNTVSVFIGNGDGTFQTPTNYPTGNAPVYVALADFNNQGAPDIAVANHGAPTANNSGNSVTIYYNQISTTDLPLGTFVAGATRDFSAGNGPTSIAIADYNLDGLPDLAIADETDNAVTLLFNTGNETFTAAPAEIPVGTAPVSIVTADFNGDGRPDVAVADSGSAQATVILNTISLLGASPGSAGTLFPGAEYLDIGLKVKATPRIHADNDVTLQLNFDISSLTNQSFNSIPVISTETVEQTVRVKQNETAVLAGFLQSQVTNAIEGNPGIANIPGLGLFDQNQNAQQQDTELLILVTPRMVRLAPKQNHAIYAGQGSLEGPSGATGAGAVRPPQEQPPPQLPPQPPQPPAEQPQPPGPPGAGQAPPQPPGEEPAPPEPGGRPER